ncbi:hypothetical protein RvY_14296 [Ramazzottius varieornatus]|uniref:Uncharacterized protein n=1 Tax=Ramazzottius varieornatus TaxID=947166 RepID=A0A1D1VQU3_RAMVA|nr:hypothetical protein RvY_14296 [Ramazzottius varieornatus]
MDDKVGYSFYLHSADLYFGDKVFRMQSQSLRDMRGYISTVRVIAVTIHGWKNDGFKILGYQLYERICLDLLKGTIGSRLGLPDKGTWARAVRGGYVGKYSISLNWYTSLVVTDALCNVGTAAQHIHP